MKTLVLHGRLKKFGKKYKLDIANIPEGIRALSLQIPGFREDLYEGKYFIYKDKRQISEEELELNLGKTEKVHIVPVVQGSKGSGKAIGMAVLGVALVASAFIFAPAAGLGASVLGTSLTFGKLALIGGALAFAGAASLLAPTPKVNSQSYQDRESPSERKSFLYDGPKNTSKQGLPVAIAYGRVIIGSDVVSQGIDTVEI